MRASATDDGFVWIFGYGSLMWRPGFSYHAVQTVRLHGWVRRFWQGSDDHRGTPEAPGRVVTLNAMSDGFCDGRVYAVRPSEQAAVLAMLDHREQGGYQRLAVQVCADELSVPALTYYAPPTNSNYLGPAPFEEMVAQIKERSGPSGTNRDYVLQLDERLRSLDIEDAHVHALAEAIRMNP